MKTEKTGKKLALEKKRLGGMSLEGANIPNRTRSGKTLHQTNTPKKRTPTKNRKQEGKDENETKTETKNRKLSKHEKDHYSKLAREAMDLSKKTKVQPDGLKVKAEDSPEKARATSTMLKPSSERKATDPVGSKPGPATKNQTDENDEKSSQKLNYSSDESKSTTRVSKSAGYGRLERMKRSHQQKHEAWARLFDKRKLSPQRDALSADFRVSSFSAYDKKPTRKLSHLKSPFSIHLLLAMLCFIGALYATLTKCSGGDNNWVVELGAGAGKLIFGFVAEVIAFMFH